MTILLALSAAVLFGSGDFAAGLAARRARALAVAAGGRVVGLVVVAVAVPLVPGTLDAAAVGWGAAAGIVGILALVLFYRALAVGSMSVVAPITALAQAVVPVAVGLAFGERPAGPALLGMALALVATPLIAADRPLRRRSAPPAGLVAAVVAGVGFGVFAVCFAAAGPSSGLWALAAARVASLPVLLLVARGRVGALVPRGAPIALVVAAGAGDTLGNVLFVLAIGAGLLSVSGVLVALGPAATVLLAVLVLRERLTPLQVLGLLLAVGGVALIALH